MKNFYTIILILCSDDLPIYKYNELIWKKYMGTNNEILSLFIKYDMNIDEETMLIEQENLLLVKGEEKYNCEQIFNKTIKALKFCYQNYKFNYILRTNLSTFWVYDNLLNFLKLDNKRNYIYGWKVKHLINNLNNDIKQEYEYFISGTGIIIHSRLVPLIFNHTEFKCIMDDVEISQFYQNNNVQIKDACKHNPNYLVKFEYNDKDSINVKLNKLNKLNDKNICFRVKSVSDRESNDKYVLDNLLLKYYNKKITEIDLKLYALKIKDTKNTRIDLKLYDLKTKDKIIFFASTKATQYSGYVVDVIKKYLGKKIIHTNDFTNADIIISHITDRRKLFVSYALNIIISGESRNISDTYDIYIGTKIDTIASISLYVPYLYLSLSEHKKSICPTNYLNNKKYFCAYMYCYDIPHRVKYFNLLNNYKLVHGLGKSCNNYNQYDKSHNTRNTDGNDGNNDDRTYLDVAVELYSNYKFVLALENFYQDGYFTEKIINPLIANSIPIYWGTPDVFNYINKKRVIYVQDYSNDDELLEKIIQIDSSEEEYNKILLEPIYIKEPKIIFDEFEEKIKNLFS